MATALHRLLLGAFLLAIVASCAHKSDVIASPTLQNIYWKLVELNGKPVTVADNQQEPHIVLRDSQPPALGGSGGCNRLRGTYALDGDAIIFDRIAMTMMACPQGMDTEQAFVAVLEGRKFWSIHNNELTLKDATGKTVARFSVQYL
jgi:heat shock protein HslJ